MMPAISDGLGGAYNFGRAAMGSAQAQSRYFVGIASGAEYAALRARAMLGAQQMPARYPSQGVPPPANREPVSTGTGARMLAQLARLRSLGRR